MGKQTTADDFYSKYHGDFAAVGTKYVRLRGMLDASLVDGFWGEEGRLPTEHELAPVTGMSLGTIQRALRELVSEGRVVRMPGRGSFAVRPKFHLGAPFVNARFLNDDGKSILPIVASLEGRKHLSAKGAWTNALKPANGSVYRIERVFDVNGEFRVLSRFYIDPVRFPKCAQLSAAETRTTNLKQLLTRMYRLPQITHHQTLRFHVFPAEVARQTRCRPRTPGMLQSITASIAQDDSVYFHELFIPPNDRALELPHAVLGRNA